MQTDLTEKVALVTGSAHRVGRVIALELAKQGVNIMVHYHSAEDDAVRDTLHDIKSHGVDAFSVQADISTSEGVATIFSTVKEHFGKLDILVNSASIFNKNTLMEVTLEDWQRSLAVNVTAPFLCTQAAVRMMQENDSSGGAIVNILDYGAIRPWADRADHNVSKAALAMLTKVSALSLGKDNIRVNGIIPGPVLKDAGHTDDSWEKAGNALPIGRTGSPEDVGRAVVYLASQDFITGTILEVNGGEHL
jgi:NAD(P)-dependent dehydrogenase (short-subunit alcohol dehydrogenase family)